ncbi:MAG: hypothetical protein EA406_07735 [Rhodospirillales bacterium]|nr:MAG: hypothetical protein EA406_07735 [Rhodospirillales bacterium]
MDKKRAVVLVHGYGHFKRNERRDILVRSLALNDPLPVAPPTDAAIEGETFKRLRPAQGQDPARPVVDVYEAHWSDMIPQDAEASPLSRFVNSTKLVAYWLMNPWWLKTLRMSRSFTAGLVLSGLLILLWYVSIIVALAVLMTAEGSPGEVQALPDDSDLVSIVLSGLRPVFVEVESMARTPAFVFMIALLSFLRIDALASIASFARLYLLSGANQGFEAELIQRVQDVLEKVYARRRDGEPERPEYDEVILLGHSLGGVIALEAIANYGNPAVQQRTVLVTWGSPLAMLSHRSPERIAVRLKQACEGSVPRWVDVYSKNDWLSSPVKEHLEAYPNASFSPEFTVAWWYTLAQSHNQYYYHSDVLRMLLDTDVMSMARLRSVGTGVESGD